MAKSFNLSDDVDSGFEIIIKDKNGTDRKYYFTYPSAKDLAPAKDIDASKALADAELEAAQTPEDKKIIEEKIEAIEKAQAEVFYKLIAPMGHDVSIQSLLEEVNIKIVGKFNNLIKEQLSAD